MNPFRNIFYVLIIDAVCMIVILLIINSLPVPFSVPCTYPLAQNIALALCISLGVHFLFINRTWPSNPGLVILIYSVFLILILALGSYTFSPLGFSTGRIPVLRGFTVTRFGRPPISITSGNIVTIAANSVTGIRPIVLPGSMTCYWASNNGGALDDPGSCDVAYLPPPGADFDILKVLVQPSCHMPVSHGEIRVSIQP